MYTDQLVQEYEQLCPCLPSNAGAILDVGCGIAGIQALLYRHYVGSSLSPEVHLLDKDGTSELFYGFREVAAFYNSLELARAFLVANGVPRGRVQTFDANSTGFPSGQSYDVIISLLSWGHHYPVSTYLDAALASLNDHGVLILDVRRDSQGLSCQVAWRPWRRFPGAG